MLGVTGCALPTAPVPNAPLELSPQQKIVPFAVRAQAIRPAAATSTTGAPAPASSDPSEQAPFFAHRRGSTIVALTHAPSTHVSVGVHGTPTHAPRRRI